MLKPDWNLVLIISLRNRIGHMEEFVSVYPYRGAGYFFGLFPYLVVITCCCLYNYILISCASVIPTRLPSPGTAYSENARMRGNGGQVPSPIKRAGAEVTNPEYFHAV